MLKQLKKSNNKGFTIIEVMVVLAIAGLILVIVLLAVPALQRNSRNTAIKSDASQTLGYIGDNVATNDGKAITGGLIGSGTVSVTNTQTTTGKISSGTSGGFVAGVASTAHPTVTPGTITVYRGESCGTTFGKSYTEPASLSPRAVAVVYAIESQSGDQAKCIDG